MRRARAGEKAIPYQFEKSSSRVTDIQWVPHFCRSSSRSQHWQITRTFLQHRFDPQNVLDSGIQPEHVDRQSYLEYVRECVDLLIQHGTDRYGSVHSPMLMNILDVRTRECPADPLELDERFRVTRRGRRGPGGGNLYADLPTIAAMVRLSRVSGDDRYRQFAGTSANYTMTELVDDKGFFWWGWHRHYDAHRDVMTGHAGNHHEIHIQRVDWPLLWEVNSQAVRREIEAIWQWHVIDKMTGEVNRHGDGQRGCDFAMSAGEMIAAFAFLHTKTDDTRWLDRAKLLAGYYWERRNKQTNLIANRPNAGKDRFDGSHFDTSITGFLCRGLLDAHEYTGDPLFCEHALAYLRAYAKLGYDADAGKYWGCLKLDGTPEPGPRVVGGYAQYEPRGHIDLWQPYAAGYEHPIHTAQIYARAHKLTGDKAMLQAAMRWAEFIRAGLPATNCLKKTWYGQYAERVGAARNLRRQIRQNDFLLLSHAASDERRTVRTPWPARSRPRPSAACTTKACSAVIRPSRTTSQLTTLGTCCQGCWICTN